MKINIKGPIIPSNHQWIYDWLGMEATSPKRVSDEIAKAGKQDLEIEINSGGGSVFDASEIYTALKSYPGNVTVKIVGIAASAASVIAMAGNKVMMSPTAQMMIHNASTYMSGDYRDMDHASNFLKNTNQTIANAYSLKSGKPYEELLSMMDDETWLNAEQAKEQNLIDEIMFQDEIKFVASADEGGLLPQQVIDKIRNEFLANAPQNQVDENPVDNIDTNNQKEDKKIMNLEQLKNDYPELYQQVKNEGYEAGVQAENARIKAIDELGVAGSEELANQAKYETMATAEQLAVNIIKAQKQQGVNFLQNRNNDAQELNQVKGAEAPENNGSEEQKTKEAAATIANFINQKRGGVK